MAKVAAADRFRRSCLHCVLSCFRRSGVSLTTTPLPCLTRFGRSQVKLVIGCGLLKRWACISA